MTAPHPMTQAEFARLQGWSRSHVTGLKQAGRLVMVETVHGARVDVAGSLARIAATADARRDDVGARHAANRAPEVAQGGVWPALPAGAAPVPPVSEKNTAPEDPAELVGRSFQQARAVKERYQALSAKAEYEKQIGQLVDLSAVVSAGADLGTWLRATVDNLVPQLAAEISAAHDAEQSTAILVERFEILLNDYSSRISAALTPENMTK